jgi:hypothetical protein
VRSAYKDDKIKEDAMGGACSTYGKMKDAYKIFIRNPEGKRPLGRPRCSWEDNIKIDLNERRWEGVEWIHLAQDRD